MVTCRWRDARIVMRYKAGIAAKSGASHSATTLI